MYIWILLATIMIALSFMNLSPRADKEGVFTETRAASLVNRFRIEHSAFSRVAECKMLNSIAETDEIIKFPENELDQHIWENKSLPIGYTRGNDLNAFHYIYCLDSDLVQGNSPEISDTCVHSLAKSAFRYSVSFAPLPNRWRSKEVSSEALPVLKNAVAKQFVKGSVLGMVSCSADDTEGSLTKGNAKNCTFIGSNAYEKQKHTGLTRLSFTPGAGNDFYSELFANTDYKQQCAGNICFFAVHRLSNRDVSHHCKSLFGSEYQLPEPQEDE